MNEKIIRGSELNTPVAVISYLSQAALKLSLSEALVGVVSLLHIAENTITSTIKKLIITLKKLPNLSAVNSRGSETGKTIPRANINSQMICPVNELSHHDGNDFPFGFKDCSKAYGIMVLKSTI